MYTRIYSPRALSPSIESVFMPHYYLKNDDGTTLWYPTANAYHIQNFGTSVVWLLQQKKGNPVQERTDWSIVHMKGKVIIYFPLVFKFHQPKLHLHMQLSHFKKNW